MNTDALERCVISWNRTRFDPQSDEMLAQVLDRGDLQAWQQLYALAAADPALRGRVHRLIRLVPLPYAGFWLAALAGLGEAVDWTAPLPVDPGVA
jgi:hypothetical protein